jgi:hypothetical protein
MDKLSTFAPALLERQSLMIDILLMIKGSENKNKKNFEKSLDVIWKSPYLCIRFRKESSAAKATLVLWNIDKQYK